MGTMFAWLRTWLTRQWRVACLVLSDQSGQIPSSLTNDYEALLSTTLRNFVPRLRDNITRSNKWIAWLRSKGRFRMVDGGERIAIPLMHAQSSTADIYSGYGTLDTTPQEGITTAFYEWTQLSVSISISRKEERQNSGRSRILSLLEAKTMQARVSVEELLNNCIVSGKISSGATGNRNQFVARTGKLDSGASGPLPLTALVDSNASRSVSIGNINGNTHSFWRNTATASTATTFAGYKQELNKLYNDVSKGVGGSPDIFVMDQIAWETYFNALQSQERYVNPEEINVFAGVSGNKDALKFRGAIFVWDEVVPDVGATTADVVDSIGTIAQSTVYALNSESMEWVTDASTDFIATPMVRPENQDARVGQILWMGAVGTNNRRKNGVLDEIAQNITS